MDESYRLAQVLLCESDLWQVVGEKLVDEFCYADVRAPRLNKLAANSQHPQTRIK
jgi:hypothetical protein